MEKRYQVFVSSTFRDLEQERREVIQALLEIDCIPIGMELFPAASDDQWTFIKRVIEDCDYYIVIVAGRYGSLDAEGVSFTEREFDYAVTLGRPVLAFLHGSPDSLPGTQLETTDAGRGKLIAFRQKAESRRLVKYWKSAEDLGGQVSRSVLKLLKTAPGEGWVRGRFAASPGQSEEVNNLRERVRELEGRLSDVVTEGPPGTEDLQHGTDIMDLDIRRQHKRTGWANVTVRMTWNEIFAAVGGGMFTPVSEPAMVERLQRVIKEAELGGPEAEVYEVEVRTLTFLKVKIQLTALGLIELFEADDGGNAPLWALTDFGVHHLTSLLALRRSGPEA